MDSRFFDALDVIPMETSQCMK